MKTKSCIKSKKIIPSKIDLLLKLIIMLFITPFSINAQYQQDNSINEFISVIDSGYGSDFLLKNGRIYINEHTRANGNPFFMSDIWYNSKLVLDNKEYKDFKIKYDICNDKVLCVINGPEKIDFPIVLNSDFINGFKIDNHQFIHATQLASPLNGFYELIYSGKNIQAIAKWSKKFSRIYTAQYQGEFTNDQKVLHVIMNKNIYSINDEKDFLKLFAINKKVKDFMRSNHIKLLKSDNENLIKLFQFCDETIENQSNR